MMHLNTIPRQIALIIVATIFLFACEQVTAPAEISVAEQPPGEDPVAAVNTIADRYYETTLERTPEVAYFSGVEIPRHDGMEDNSPAARQTLEQEMDAMLAALERVDAAALNGKTEWITHAYLLQTLRAAVALRVCRAMPDGPLP